jgi:hypothetical protein
MNMLDVEKIIHTIGLDIDKKDKKYLEKTQDSASVYGMIQTTQSKNGYHIKIKLNKPVKLKESLWIRYYLNDDKMRLLFDCLRIVSDIDDIDVLWDIKEKKLLKDMMINS